MANERGRNATGPIITSLKNQGTFGSSHSATPISAATPFSARDQSPPALAWERTLAKYRSDPSLTDEERKVFELDSLDDFVSDLQTQQVTEIQKSKISRCMEKLKPVLEIFKRFESAIDLVSGADPYGVLSLLWGSLRMVLVVAKDVSDLYEGITSFFQEFGDAVGRLTAYEKLFAKNARFNKALCCVFESLLDFCAWIRGRFRSHKTKMLLKLAFSDSITKEANLRIANFKALCIKTESEAQLAGAEASIKFQNEATEFFKDERKRQKDNARRDIAQVENSLLRELREKLSPLPVAEFLETLQTKRFQGTCAWVLNHPDFMPLLSGDLKKSSRVTWITGVPGSGKTYLSAFLIEKLEDIGPVAYFFCDTKDQSKKNVLNIIRTLAWQLLHKAQHAVGDAVRMLSSVIEVTKKVLHKIFSLLFREGHASYIVLDGLDELEPQDRGDLLEFMQDFAGKANILIVSRKEPDIDQALNKFKRSIKVSRIHISAKDNKVDIERYIQESVKQLGLQDRALLAKIVAQVGNQAQGMFLYARLMIKELDMQDTDDERLEVLMQLPDGIDAIYNRSLDKIQRLEGKRKARILKLISWAVCAARPITVQELEIALAVSPEDTEFHAKNVPNVRKLFVEYLTSLLELSPGDTGELTEPTATLSVIHATAKDFLTRKSSKDRLVDPGEAHAMMAATCLTYIHFEDIEFVDRSMISLDEIPALSQWPYTEYLHQPFYFHIENTPFFMYSVANWVHHVSQMKDMSIQKPWVQECLQALKNILSSERSMLKWYETFHFLYVANLEFARSACAIIDDWILEYESRKRESDGHPGSPVKSKDEAKTQFTFSLNSFRQDNSSQAARDRVRESNNYFSKEQLDFLGSPWSKAMSHLGFSGPRGMSRWRRATKTEPITRPPFQLGAYFNCTQFMQEELKNGVDVETRGPMDRTPLEKAAFGEAVEAARLLVENGADLDHVPLFAYYDGTGPLLHALFKDQFQPLRDRDYPLAYWMLEKGARVENDISPLNPLHQIFDWWQDTETEIGILTAILNQSKDVDRLMEIPSPHHGMSSIHIVARNNLMESMRIFLSRHSDPERFVNLSWGGDAKTPLHEACYHENSICGQLLLDAKANVDKPCTVSLSTPMHIAANSRSNMVEKLVKAGASINVRDAAGRTPLHFAALQDWSEGVQLLLHHGADVNVVDNQGQTALDLAISVDAEHTPRILRDAGALASESNAADKIDWPSTPKDVFEVAYLLKRNFSGRAPSELISRIVDQAEYWLKTSAEASHPTVCMQADAGRPYMISKPISGNPRRPVRKMVVEVQSEGVQGSEPRHFPGEKSWTWFEIGKKEARDQAVETGPRLFTNELHVDGVQNHSTTVYCDLDLSDQLAIWARKLERGTTVCILPMARWPKWMNKVHGAKLDIYTSCLKPAWSDEEYLKDWKSDDWLVNVLR